MNRILYNLQVIHVCTTPLVGGLYIFYSIEFETAEYRKTNLYAPETACVNFIGRKSINITAQGKQ